MPKYYCRPIKLYVSVVCRERDGIFEALLFGFTNGDLLFPITLSRKSSRKFCGYINTKDYPWLYEFLTQKKIAYPTGRRLKRDDFLYDEFKFIKEKCL